MLKGTNHDKTNYTHFSRLCKVLYCKRAGCMLGGSGGAVKAGTHSIAGRDWGEGWRAGAGGPPAVGGSPLTRRRPGSGAGALRPERCCTRCGHGHAGAPLGRRPPPWRLDTGSRALWARGENTRFRSSLPGGNCPASTHTPRTLLPVGQGWTPAPLPSRNQTSKGRLEEGDQGSIPQRMG